MSTGFDNMNSHTSHRLISLFEVLSRRYFKWSLPNVNQPPDSVPNQDKIDVYFEFLKMLFEVINGCIYFSLSKNPHLIYTLLYSKDIFSKFHSIPQFSPYLANIQIIIDFFEDQLQNINFDFSDYSIDSVLDSINSGLLEWKNIYFKYQVNKIYYKFTPSENSADFYLPHTWASVMSSLLFWPHPLHFNLFSTHNSSQLPRYFHLQYSVRNSSPILDV